MNKGFTPLKLFFYFVSVAFSLFADSYLKADDVINDIISSGYGKNAFSLKHNLDTPLSKIHHPSDPIVLLKGKNTPIRSVFNTKNVISVFDVNPEQKFFSLDSIFKKSDNPIYMAFYNYFLIDEDSKQPIYFSNNRVSISCNKPYSYKTQWTGKRHTKPTLFNLPPMYFSQSSEFQSLKDDSLSRWVEQICTKQSFIVNNIDDAINKKLEKKVVRKKKNREKNAFLGIKTLNYKPRSFNIDSYRNKRFGYGISTVYRDSSAYMKGIDENDVVLGINGISVEQIVNEYCINKKLSQIYPIEKTYTQNQHEDCATYLGWNDSYGEMRMEIYKYIQQLIEDDFNNGRMTILTILKNGGLQAPYQTGCESRDRDCEQIQVKLEPSNVDEFMKNYY